MTHPILVTGAAGGTQGSPGRVVARLLNQRNLGNWLRQFEQFMMAPLSPGFQFDRYDRELRRPFPSEPQFALESNAWSREHGISDLAKPAPPVLERKATSATSRGQWLESQLRRWHEWNQKLLKRQAPGRVRSGQGAGWAGS